MIEILAFISGGRKMTGEALRSTVLGSRLPAAITRRVSDYVERQPDRRFGEVLWDDFARPTVS